MAKPSSYTSLQLDTDLSTVHLLNIPGSLDGHVLSDVVPGRNEEIEALKRTASWATEFLTKLYHTKSGDPGPEWGTALGSKQCSALRSDRKAGASEESRGMEMTDSLHSIESTLADPGHTYKPRAVPSTSTIKKCLNDAADSGSHLSSTNPVPYSSTGNRGMDWAVMMSDVTKGPASSNSALGCGSELEADGETLTPAADSQLLDSALDFGPRERVKKSQLQALSVDRGGLGHGEISSKMESSGNRSMNRKDVQSEKTRTAAGGTIEKRRSLPILKEGKLLTTVKT
jgi:hypothetical protein